MLDLIQQLDLTSAGFIALVLAAAVGAAVQVIVEHMLNRWVPEPRHAKPEPEYIM
jgi:hypothetical protein